MKTLPLLLVALVGCAPPCPELCAALDGTPSVVLATGEEEATPVADGSTVDFVQGAQGGYHIEGAAILEGMLASGPSNTFSDPCNPRIDFTVSGPDIGDGWVEVPRQFLPRTDGRADLVAQRVVLDIDGPDVADGATVELAVKVTDTCGQVATALHSVRLHYAGSAVDPDPEE
ncbi:MAG: hypothetical protein H6732_02320 [Alphaproteobacteria bacterium]|nr:hypothetical protein [Alphaproteobacteria bacterium]